MNLMLKTMSFHLQVRGSSLWNILLKHSTNHDRNGLYWIIKFMENCFRYHPVLRISSFPFFISLLPALSPTTHFMVVAHKILFNFFWSSEQIWGLIPNLYRTSCVTLIYSFTLSLICQYWKIRKNPCFHLITTSHRYKNIFI